jgi:copper(I)-binding protein
MVNPARRRDIVTLAPSGFHIMFRDLKHPLEEGATLKFDKGGSIDVEYSILAVGATAPAASGGGMKMQGSGGGMMQMDKH